MIGDCLYKDVWLPAIISLLSFCFICSFCPLLFYKLISMLRLLHVIYATILPLMYIIAIAGLELIGKKLFSIQVPNRINDAICSK